MGSPTAIIVQLLLPQFRPAGAGMGLNLNFLVHVRNVGLAKVWMPSSWWVLTTGMNLVNPGVAVTHLCS